MSEQGHHEHHGFCRGAQPIEDGTFAGAEGFVTLVADEALLLLRMDTDIAHTSLASGMAMLIGAEYGRGVHDAPPGCAWKHCHEKYVWTPVCFTTSLHHDLVRSYPIWRKRQHYLFSTTKTWRPLWILWLCIAKR